MTQDEPARDTATRPSSGPADLPTQAVAPATGRAGRIEACIGRRFAPIRMVLQDDSAHHAGHAGMRGHDDAGRETHFTLLVVSEAFVGLGRVQRSRAVQEALADEFHSGLHALSMTLRTPAEQSAQPSGSRSGIG